MQLHRNKKIDRSEERESIKKTIENLIRMSSHYPFTLNMRTRLANIKCKANGIRYIINIHFE